MACHVTMRGERALDILKKGLRVKDNELKKKNFSNTGIFYFICQYKLDFNTFFYYYYSLFVNYLSFFDFTSLYLYNIKKYLTALKHDLLRSVDKCIYIFLYN